MVKEVKRENKKKNEEVKEAVNVENKIKGEGQIKARKKRREVFPYGNYKNYYGYRIGGDEDPRLKVFKKEWFEDKDCLDIGCNNGIITIQIAKKFSCRSILGIDIDPDRVADACWHLRKIVRKESAEKTHPETSKLEAAEFSNASEKKTTSSLNSGSRDFSENSPKQENLFDVVSFRQENFIQNRRLSPGKHYDTILCLSVTKWVHLNWGDDGLVTLFTKIWRLLHPGGILVLEPQPWKSYESNHLVSEIAATNYKSISLRPECFQEILLDKIGFRSVEDLTSSLSVSKTGFKRPILAFYK